MTLGRWILWGVFGAPLALQCYWYITGATFYGEILGWTGVQTVRLLIITLMVTPLMRFWRGQFWVRWLARHRRDLGVATFAYAAVHTAVYLHYKADLARIMDEALDYAMFAGWIAMVLMLLLAITSNHFSVRKMGRRWRQLHKSVYLLAILSCIHWIGTAFDPTSGVIHAIILGGLLLLRIRFTPTNRPA